MNTQLFIPTKLKVGYCKRDDTYTKKLAYVIYYDSKNVLRKETSWQGWRDKKITPDDYDNVPTEGFVLNKGVGGTRESYGWNARNEYIRVYDPRGFEFEISVANLLFILQECTSTKGKGLEGEFVYSWDGKELVLLPVSSSEYKKCTEYTKLQDGKVSTKSLVEGHTYKTKKQEELVYLGKFNWYDLEYKDKSNSRYSYGKTVDYTEIEKESKQFVFYNEKNKSIVNLKSITNLAECISSTINVNYATYLDKFLSMLQSGKIVELIEKELDIKTINDIQFKKEYDWAWEIKSKEFFIKNGNKYHKIKFTRALDSITKEPVENSKLYDQSTHRINNEGNYEICKYTDSSGYNNKRFKQNDNLGVKLYEVKAKLNNGKIIKL
jgi:hypothetical protein